MKIQQNKRTRRVSKSQISSIAQALSNKLDKSKEYYDMLRAGYLLRGSITAINPEEIQEKMRLLHIDLESQSQELESVKKKSLRFPGLKSQCFVAECFSRTIAANIEKYYHPI